MIFQSVYPCMALQEYISLYRIRHFIIPPGFTPYPKPYPPHPEQCMIFYPRGAEVTSFFGEDLKSIRPRSLILGQFTKRIDRSSLNDEILLIVVAFKPGALHRLTGIPFRLLINRIVDLEAVYPKRAREINEKLGECQTYGQMIEVIETFLLYLTETPKMLTRRSDKIFDFMVRNTGNYTLDWLANEACMSARQFERKSQDYIGISPKLFARIARFNQSYYMSMKEERPHWLDVSLYCGYHDYQHLVKDYKEFAGATPRFFFEEESRALERALGLSS